VEGGLGMTVKIKNIKNNLATYFSFKSALIIIGV